jgi:P-type Cu+ transporter
MERNGVDVEILHADATTIAANGETPVFVGLVNPTKQIAGVLAIADPVRSSSRAAVTALRQLGLEVVMLTGDRQETADAIANAVGITQVIAGVLPRGKVDAIRGLQAGSRVVAMVGDGINDAPALAQADIGIAMGGGTDVALDAADIALLRPDLNALVSAIRLSRRTIKTMRQNLFWAFVYNVIGIPIAAGVLYPLIGLLLSPMIASAAMAGSSVSVVSNSLRLRRASV